MIRRAFLSSLVRGAAGLLVADDALELLTEPRRKLWPGWSAPGFDITYDVYTMDGINRAWRDQYVALIAPDLATRSALGKVTAVDARRSSITIEWARA